MAETQEQELLSKKIKHGLENWRELVLFMYDVIIWKNITVFPAVIFGVSTFIFISIILLDPTLLSFISSVCLCLVIADFVMPIVMSKIFHPDSWTGAKEKQLDEICSQIARSFISIKSDVYYFYSLKDLRPKLYYAVVITGLVFLSWLGNNVNNVFLTYLFVTFILLLPGLKYHGYLQKASSFARQYLSRTFRSIGNKKDKKQ